MSKYAIGLDYGTLSVRALLINAETGQEIAQSVYEYPHGVMDERLWDGTVLPVGFALQHPDDYRNGLVETIRGVLKKSGIDPIDVIGIGMDATGSNVMPVRYDGTPLCLLPGYEHEPHAYIKLWKHHGGEEEAVFIKKTAVGRNEDWLSFYGGDVSSEWTVPKILETLHKAPSVYENADLFIDTADWINFLLTGEMTRSACILGYKAFYRKDRNGFPDPDFFEALDPRFKNVCRDKLAGPVLSPGDKAGFLTAEMAETLGLPAGIPVAAALLDAHASVWGSGVTDPGEMVIVMGTSSCHLLLTESGAGIPGVAGVVYDGIVKDLYGCESGQSCVGDGFGAFVDNFVPAAYEREAEERGISVHELLSDKIRDYRPGQSGLLALDWFNGVRSPLMDFDLNGLILGMNLKTRPEEIYMALIEATAFGTDWIVEQYEEAGTPITSLALCGGIPLKNPLLVQIYADILNRPIRVVPSTQAVALGSAIQAVIAAGPETCGFTDRRDAVRHLAGADALTYSPRTEYVPVYRELCAEYRRLAAYFGQGGNNIMKKLNAMRAGLR